MDTNRSFNRYYHASTGTRANSVPDILRVVDHWLEEDCEFKVHSRNLTKVHCRARRPVRRKLEACDPLEQFDDLTTEETDDLFRVLFLDPVETTISGDAPSDMFDLPQLMPELPTLDPPPVPEESPELKRLGEFATTRGPRGLGVFSTPKSKSRLRARSCVVYSDSDPDEPHAKKRVRFSDTVEYVPKLEVAAKPVAPVAPVAPVSPVSILQQIQATTEQLAALHTALQLSVNA